MKAGLLRLQLPPWAGSEASRAMARCAYRQPDGTWCDAGALAMDAIAGSFRPKRMEACLHPGDLPMAAFSLPPLAGRRLRSAVLGAIEPCALQPLESLATGFGPRGADGTVPAAWIGRERMDGWLALLRRHGIAVRALHPPAAFLPAPAEGWTACRIDHWLVVRTGRDQGFTHWLPEGIDPEAGIAACAGPAALPPVRWVDAEGAGDGPGANARWSGEGWSWSLAAGASATAGAGAALVKPAIAWGAIAAAVWITGLNIHASQLSAQGLALKREMAARVKAAFPDLPIVLNPLQQARQQKAALAAGAAPSSSASDEAGVLRAAANLLADTASGQVQGLRYKAGELRIRWRDGGAPAADALHALQARGKEQGWSIETGADGWRITAAAGLPAAESAGAPKGTQ